MQATYLIQAMQDGRLDVGFTLSLFSVDGIREIADTLGWTGCQGYALVRCPRRILCSALIEHFATESA